MCGECQWTDNRDQDANIHQKCDCGNSEWKKVQQDQSINKLEAMLYRCTKCDSLQQFLLRI